MASLRISSIFSRVKPPKPPKSAVTARVCRNLHKLTKDHVVPSAELKADYDWYIAMKRKRNAAVS